MGESYLQRKVLDKMRRSRTQASILSSFTGTASLTNGLDSPIVNSSSVSVEPANILRDSPTMDQITSESSNETSRRDQPMEDTNKTGSRPRNLKRASKAIVFFRRAASSMARAAGHTPTERQSTKDSASDSNQYQTSANSNLFMVPNTGALRMPIVCLIRSIEGELMRELFVHRYELGQFLMESLKVSLNLQDSKYFGLRLAKHSQDQDDLENPWLDMNEPVWKQIKLDKAALAARKKQQKQQQQQLASEATELLKTGSSSEPESQLHRPGTSRSIELYLRIKFYPPNVGRISDQFLRNYLWLQLRRDLRLGKLTSSMNNLAHLMACALQFELGDHRPELLELVPTLNILPNQDVIEGAALHLWRTKLAGIVKHQSQMQFIRAAMILETYGFDYYPVRDHQRQRAYLLGFNYAGVKTIRNGRIVHHFAWHNLNKISYERRMIIFHVYPAQNSKRKQILGFKCLSNADCQHLYLRLLEQKYFFTVDLAYFDQSIRRPSCLHSTESGDWSCSLDDLAGRLPGGFSPTDSPPTTTEHPALVSRNPSGDSSIERLSQHSNDTTADLQPPPPTSNHCDNPSRCALNCPRPADRPQSPPIDHLWTGRLSGLTERLASQAQCLLSLGVPQVQPDLETQQQRGWVLPTLRFCAVVFAMNFLLRLADGISSSLMELLTITRSAAPN